MDERSARTKQLWLFVIITFAITYLYEFTVVTHVANTPSLAPYVTLAVSFCMFLPSLGVVITRLVTKQGFGDLWLKPNFKKNIRYYLGAWLLPVVACLGGAVIYFVIFPEQFDIEMGMLVALSGAQGQAVEPSAARNLILIQLAAGLVIAPVANFVTCLGEEWGWRGYMMPRLAQRFSFLTACLIGGVLWGLWHAPLTMLGHNYGLGYAGYPFTGIAAMCLFCVTTGTLFSYLSLRARSCIPAVIGHAMLNGFAAAPIYFTVSTVTPNPLVGPAMTGYIGGLSMVAIAVVCVLLAKKKPLDIG